jgi:hypothetical protein
MPDDPHEPTRASRRLKIFQPAALLGPDGRSRIHLLDVSRTGVLAHADLPPGPGARVELECAGLVLPARVRWRDGRRFGLEFDSPLGGDQLEIIARRGGAVTPGPAPDPKPA